MNKMILDGELGSRYANVIDENIIENIKFIKDRKGIYNPLCKIKGYNELMRGCSELIVADGHNIWINTEKEGECSQQAKMIYNVLGGGWEPNEPHYITAVREGQEKGRLDVNEIIYGGYYTTIGSEVKKWVQKEIPKRNTTKCICKKRYT